MSNPLTTNPLRTRVLLTRAINPAQYDFDDVSWESETGLHSPTRKFFFDYLSRFKNEWKGADILDIGCGTGWLLDLLQQNEAKSVEGIDPSRRNVNYARRSYDFPVHHSDLESFVSERRYDLIISVMTFGHIGEIHSAFSKTAELLKPKGTLQLIVPAYHYFRKEREGCKVEVAELNRQEYVVQVTSEQGTIAEIVRRTEVYERVAEPSGLLVQHSLPMVPTKDLIRDSPRHKAFRSEPITYLLRFTK